VSCSIEAKFWRISAKLETMAVRLSMATARDTYLSSSVTKRPLSVNKRKERHLSRSSFSSLPVLSAFFFLFSLLFLPFPCNVQLGTRASPKYTQPTGSRVGTKIITTRINQRQDVADHKRACCVKGDTPNKHNKTKTKMCKTKRHTFAVVKYATTTRVKKKSWRNDMCNVIVSTCSNQP